MRRDKQMQIKTGVFNFKEIEDGLLKILGDGLMVGTLVLDASKFKDPNSYILGILDYFNSKSYEASASPIGDENGHLYLVSYKPMEDIMRKI
ncbi:MAG: hypothetical protein QXI33_01935 [Candidatus Pacearchaeota archaeon]